MGGSKGGGGGGGDPTAHLGPEELQYLERNTDLHNVPWAVHDPRKHFDDFGKAEGRLWGNEPAGGGFDLEAFLSGLGGGGGGGCSGDYAKALAEQREKDRITAGENERDALYSEYLTAAESATDFINVQETDRIANEDLLGIEHPIRTDEQKSTMINNYFASIWGAGAQERLDTLFGEFGNPAGFEGFIVSRGDASGFDDQEGSETSAGTSGGLRPKKPTLASADDENALGAPSILGA